ncbi:MULTISPECIES: MazG-like family protein [unclassified Streptomyces]|uniref:MazG-like family protein n=1 Tax=unclassified Streptomyces TaxID=2593676 RepID=UPI003D728354
MADHDTTPLPTDPPADLWPTIDALHAWLERDESVAGREGLLLRMLKLSEEVGEVAEAVIGAVGQNPRKGVSHSWDDVRAELCDVVVTALVALRTLTPEPREVLTRHLSEVAARSLTAGGESAAEQPGQAQSRV